MTAVPSVERPHPGFDGSGITRRRRFHHALGLVNPVPVTARALGTTEGRAYTVVIGLGVGLVLAIYGIPGTLHHAPGAAAESPGPPAVGSTASGNTLMSPRPPTPASANTAADSQAAGFPDLGPATSGLTPTGPAPTMTIRAAGSAPRAPAPFGTTSLVAKVGQPGAPESVVVGPGGTIYVDTDNGASQGGRGPSHVLAYGAHGTLVHDYTISGQPPGHALGLSGMAFDPNGDLVVADIGSERLIRIDPASGAQTRVAQVPDLPACVLVAYGSPCEPGAIDHPPRPTGLAYDGHGDLYLTDPNQGTIWRLAAGSHSLSVFYQSVDQATGDGPTGITVDPEGRLVFTVGTTLDPSNPAGGALYRLPVGPGGRAGARTLVAKFARGDAPYGVSPGPGGGLVVALRGADALAVITPDGSVTRIPNPRRAPVAFDAPTGVVLDGTSVLVTNQSAAGDPDHWTVLAVEVARPRP